MFQCRICGDIAADLICIKCKRKAKTKAEETEKQLNSPIVFNRSAPAPEEKEMEAATHSAACLCGACDLRRKREHHSAERRAIYERAYLAALTSCACSCPSDHAALRSHHAALETVRRWPEFMNELEGEKG